MMKKKVKVLFVSQEITPYLEETPMSKMCRYLPQGIQEKGKEIRSFMPRFGVINERRNQLHEVIRLSGMNLIIEDTDHPIIIKVASIQAARMQVYFIDNEDYFQRKELIASSEKKEFFEDNDERMIFFCRGVLETVKKLGWMPDVVICSGWMAVLIPFYIKTAYKDNPLFAHTKVIMNLFKDDFSDKFKKDWVEKIRLKNNTDEELDVFEGADYISLMKSAVKYSDGFIQSQSEVLPEIIEEINSSSKPFIKVEIDEEKSYIESINKFIEDIKG